LPATGNFVGEFLVLLGSYRVNVALTVIAALGLIVAVVYALSLVQRTFHGPNVHRWQLTDTSPRELAILAALVAIIVWLGLYPQPVFEIATPAMRNLQALVAAPAGGGR
jgi:NADH-quinone oxidoreductase subunit M